MSLKGGLNGSSVCVCVCVCEAPCGSAIVFFNHFDFSGSIWPCFILTCIMKVCINSTPNKTKTHGIDTQKWALVCVYVVFICHTIYAHFHALRLMYKKKLGGILLFHNSEFFF